MTLNRKSGLPKHCSFEVDRHGVRRIRFRLRNVSRYITTGQPWTPEFMATYGELLAEAAKETTAPAIASRSAPNSLDALISAYLTSPRFLAGAAETRRTRENILRRFGVEHGAKALYYIDAKTGERVMLLKRASMQKIINAKASAPSAQRNFVNTTRAMFRWAMKEDRISDNPCLGVERERIATDGYKPWSEAEVARYEAQHAIGTMARVAFTLLLYTGARRGDAVRLGPANLQGDRLSYKQEKTGTVVDLPLHPRLAEILAATPTVGIRTFIVTGKGRPFSVAGFGNKFREWCNAAGCPDVSAHGLRKLCAVRLAEAGATAHEIMSVLGHATLAECERYSKAAERKRLADQAIGKLLKGGW